MIPVASFGPGDLGVQTTAPAPTGIVIVGSRTASITSGTSVTVSQPTGTGVGDVGILFGRASPGTPSPPAGWTDILTSAVWYRIYDGTETSETITNSATAPILGGLTVFRHCHATTPIEVSSSNAVLSGTTCPATPITPTTNSTLALTIARARVPTPSTVTVTAPAAYTQQCNVANTTLAGGLASVAGPPSGTATTAATWTTNNPIVAGSNVMILLRFIGT